MNKLAALLILLSVVCQDSLVCRGASLAGARFQSRLIFGQEAEVIARGFLFYGLRHQIFGSDFLQKI